MDTTKLKYILIKIAEFCLKNENSYLTLEITNLYIFLYEKEINIAMYLYFLQV